jgi:hypothetical protein
MHLIFSWRPRLVAPARFMCAGRAELHLADRAVARLQSLIYGKRELGEGGGGGGMVVAFEKPRMN